MAETLEAIKPTELAAESSKPKCYNSCALPFYTNGSGMLRSIPEANCINDHEFQEMLVHSMDNEGNLKKFKKRLLQIFHGRKIPYESRMMFSFHNVTDSRDILMKRYIGDSTKMWFNNPTGYGFFQELACVEASILYYKGMLTAYTLFFAIVKIYLMHSRYCYDPYKPHRRIEFKDFLATVDNATRQLRASKGTDASVPFPTGNQAFCNYNVRMKKTEIPMTYQYVHRLLDFNRSFAENMGTFVRETGYSKNYFYKIVKKYDFEFPGRRLPLKKRNYWTMDVLDDDWIKLSARGIMDKINAVKRYPELTINAVCMARKRKIESMGYSYMGRQIKVMSQPVFLDLIDECKSYTWNCEHFMKVSGWSASKFYQMVKTAGIKFTKKVKKDFVTAEASKICGAPVLRKDKETFDRMMGEGTDFWTTFGKAAVRNENIAKVNNPEKEEKNVCKKSNSENKVSVESAGLDFRNVMERHQYVTEKWFSEKCDSSMPYSINLEKFNADTELSKYFFVKYMKQHGVRFISRREFKHNKNNIHESEKRNIQGKIKITRELFIRFSDTDRTFSDNCRKFMKSTGKTKMTFINWMHKCNVNFGMNKKGNIYNDANKEKHNMKEYEKKTVDECSMDSLPEQKSEKPDANCIFDDKTESFDISSLKGVTIIPDENPSSSTDIPDGWKPKNEKERHEFEKLSAQSYKIGKGRYTQECLKSIDADLEEISKKPFNFATNHPWEESLAADANKLCTEEDLPTLKFKDAPPATNDFERRLDKIIERDKNTPDVFWEREMRKDMGMPYKGY